MRFDVLISKKDLHWIIEIPVLDVMTQGRTKKEAYEMLRDAVESLVGRTNFRAKIHVRKRGTEIFLTGNDQDALIALLIRRQRQRHGLTLQEVAKRLGSSSVNAIARYEHGSSRPTVAKLIELLEAINPNLSPTIKLAA